MQELMEGLNSIYCDLKKCYQIYEKENNLHFIKILEIYKDLCKKAIKIDIINNSAIYFNYMRCSLIEIKNNPYIIESLDIKNNINEIEKIYLKYGCIILRDPTSSKKLLTGCGNFPIDSYYLKYDTTHKHSEYVTLDPSLLMNPSIVGIFGHNVNDDFNIPDYFKDINYEYDLFASEGYYTFNVKGEFENNEFVKNATKYMFKKDFDIISVTDNKYKHYGKGYDGLKKSEIIYEN